MIHTLPDNIAVQLVLASPFSMVLTDPAQDGHPIVFTNAAFEATTGYSLDETLGRNCRFLQGEKTNRHAVEKISDAVRDEVETTVDILNYHKNGTPFWNRLMIAPLRNPDGDVQFFMGVQKVLGTLASSAAPENADLILQEIQHRVKNHIQMIVSLIRLHSREEDTAASFESLARRVGAIGALYDELNAGDGENHEAVVLDRYLARIARSVVSLDPERKVKLATNGPSFPVPIQAAVVLGMVVSEIVTNAMQHAFADRSGGKITLGLTERADGSFQVSISDDGIGIAKGVEWPSRNSRGGRILHQLARSISGTIDVQGTSNGTTIRIDVAGDARKSG